MGKVTVLSVALSKVTRVQALFHLSTCVSNAFSYEDMQDSIANSHTQISQQKEGGECSLCVALGNWVT